VSASTTERLLAEFRGGSRLACARLISLVENSGPEAYDVLHEIYPLTGRGYWVGITGPPGAGKSTLVEKLAMELRCRNKTVGIVAVDPTSPFSGGALLGDRVRMAGLFTDPGVFIRSMATRGGHGGLAVRTREACEVLDAFGRDFILIETVGVGQVELDVAGTADTTVVVLVPESGDAIQTMKAGLMEIGSVFCVNKSDREGADRLTMELEMMLELRPRHDQWSPPVQKTVATGSRGITQLLDLVEQHRAHLEEHGLRRQRRAERTAATVRSIVEERLRAAVWNRADVRELLDRQVGLALEGESTPYRAADEILELCRPGA
jgi:LAO/AO transport system kinase